MLVAGLMVMGLRAPPAEAPGETASSPQVREEPPAVAPAVAPTVPQLPERGLRSPEPLPRSTRVPFEWVMADWQLGRPGHWVQDTSGRDHHGLVPIEGVRGAFSGLEFLGTTGVVEIPYHPDLELRAPFSLMANVNFGSFENERGVIYWRGENPGREAVSVETRPGAVLRFSVTQQDGKVRFIEGLLPPSRKERSLMIMRRSMRRERCCSTRAVIRWRGAP